MAEPDINQLNVQQLEHQTNTHLTVLLGYLQILQPRLKPGTLEAIWVSKMLQECDAMRATVAKYKSLKYS